jgi:hypothetical protein
MLSPKIPTSTGEKHREEKRRAATRSRTVVRARRRGEVTPCYLNIRVYTEIEGKTDKGAIKKGVPLRPDLIRSGSRHWRACSRDRTLETFDGTEVRRR